MLNFHSRPIWRCIFLIRVEIFTEMTCLRADTHRQAGFGGTYSVNYVLLAAAIVIVIVVVID
jgi:hypothetical protein